MQVGANDEPFPVAVVIGPEAYVCADFAKAECDLVWRKVWQQACRAEELPSPGGNVTYEIGDDSIVILRNKSGDIRAYHNVCPHRGRPLVDKAAGAHHASGRTPRFVCGFHAWMFDLDGQCLHIPREADWNGAVTADTTQLGKVHVGEWGGRIWINLDSDCEPLRDYLEPATTQLDPFQLQNMRARWRRWLVFDCNWKVALEAFNETYHVPGTPPEFVLFGDFGGLGRPRGKHSHIGYHAPKGLEEIKSKLRIGTEGDPRKSTAEMQSYIWREVNTNTTKTLVDAAQRLVDELPEGTPTAQVSRHWIDTARADDERWRVFWPKVDPEVVGNSGTSWQIFPNFQIGHAVNNMLYYRARPYGPTPDKCIFEISVYELYPNGEAPESEWEYLAADNARWGSVLQQDFANMAEIQTGLKSVGFNGTRPNPIAEGGRDQPPPQPRTIHEQAGASPCRAGLMAKGAAIASPKSCPMCRRPASRARMNKRNAQRVGPSHKERMNG